MYMLRIYYSLTTFLSRTHSSLAADDLCAGSIHHQYPSKSRYTLVMAETLWISPVSHALLEVCHTLDR